MEPGHEIARGRLGAYLDGDLGQREREQLEDHVLHCSSCAAFAATLARTVVWLHRLPQVEMPGGARDRLRHLAVAQAHELAEAPRDVVGVGG
jgi:anti-sigma factor RsiW